MDHEGEEVKIEVKVDDDVAVGVFSNFSNMSHSPEEFILDFLFVHPSPPPGFGKLLSRIVMTPAHAKRLFLALSENLSDYEERFGEIEVRTGIEGSGSVQ